MKKNLDYLKSKKLPHVAKMAIFQQMNTFLGKGYKMRVKFTLLEFYKSWHLSRGMWFLFMLYDWIPTAQ